MNAKKAKKARRVARLSAGGDKRLEKIAYKLIKDCYKDGTIKRI